MSCDKQSGADPFISIDDEINDILKLIVSRNSRQPVEIPQNRRYSVTTEAAPFWSGGPQVDMSVLVAVGL